MATVIAYAQFTKTKVGVNSLAVTWDVERITRSDGTRNALVTGGANSVTIGRRGLYGYLLTGADLILYDYVFTAITSDSTVDQQEIAAMWTLWSISWHDIATSIMVIAGSIGKLLTDNINDTITSRASASIFTGITSMANWLRGLYRKDAMDATAKTEINAGGGAYSETTDSQEALADNKSEFNSATDSVTVGTNNDKTDYGLSATQSFDLTGDITGNLSGSVGSVTTVNDKTGYSLLSPQSFDLTGDITGNLSGSVGSVAGGVTVTTNNDKTGYSLSAAGITAIWNNSIRTLTSFGTLVRDIWAYAIRTLTNDPYEVTGSLPTVDVTVYKYTTISIPILGLGDLTGYTNIWVTGKNNLSDEDADSYFQVDTSTGLIYLYETTTPDPLDASITIDDLVLGNIVVDFTIDSSAALPAIANKLYDVKVDIAGAVSIARNGKLTIKMPVTRAIPTP